MPEQNSIREIKRYLGMPHTVFYDTSGKQSTQAVSTPLQRTLGRVIGLVMAAAGALGLINLLFFTLRDAMVAGIILTYMACCALALRLNYPRLATALTLVGLLAGGAMAMVLHGSVRASTNFMVIGAVVFAGTVMGQRALGVSVGLAALILGGVIGLERSHLLPVADFGLTVRFPLTQSVALVCIAFVVYYGRQKKEEMLAERIQALDLRERAERERDRSLRRFARIFNITPTPLMVQAAGTGSVLDVNPAFERLFGYKRDVVFGRTNEFLWADHALRSAYVKRLQGKKSLHGQRCMIRCANGNAVPVLMSSQYSQESEQKLIITSMTIVSDALPSLPPHESVLPQPQG